MNFSWMLLSNLYFNGPPPQNAAYVYIQHAVRADINPANLIPERRPPNPISTH